MQWIFQSFGTATGNTRQSNIAPVGGTTRVGVSVDEVQDFVAGMRRENGPQVQKSVLLWFYRQPGYVKCTYKTEFYGVYFGIHLFALHSFVYSVFRSLYRLSIQSIGQVVNHRSSSRTKQTGQTARYKTCSCVWSSSDSDPANAGLIWAIFTGSQCKSNQSFNLI